MNPKSLTWASRGARAGYWVFLTLTILMIAAHTVALFQDAHRVSHMVRFMSLVGLFERPFVALIHAVIPTRIGGRDITVFLAGLMLYAIALLFEALGKKFAKQAKELEKDAELRKVEGADREKLLEIYSQAKTKLDGMKKSLAFLSMDVVDSTGLKQGEDAGVAERDFRQYKQLVEKILGANKVLKSAWTPDGVMACFPSAEAAVRAGGETIIALRSFNADVKKLRGEFRVRAGVNAGDVLFDEKTPMEEMSDRVIDVAGHMQKYGAANAVSAPASCARSLPADLDFSASGRVVDGQEVSQWFPSDAARTPR